MNNNSTSKRVVVIGAGPCGIVQLRHLKDQQVQQELYCFEAKSDLGGLWKTDPINERNHPDLKSDPYFQLYGALHSSMYETIQCDIPTQLMAFKGFPYQSEVPQFAGQPDFEKYLHAYAEKHSLKQHIHFNTLVTKVRLLSNLPDIENLLTRAANSPDKNAKFAVFIASSDPKTKIERDVYFVDHVVIANGHFSVPRIPDLEGLQTWDGEHSHSHVFRRDLLERLNEKTVLILGSHVTGLDLIFQLRTKLDTHKAKKVIIVGDQLMLNFLKKSEDLRDDLEQQRVVPIVGTIKKLLPGKVAELSDGTVTEPLDYIILATGYKYSFPFLDPADEILKSYNQKETCQGPIYQLIVPINEPALFFLGLTNSSLASMQVKERQAIVISRLIGGQISLPSKEDMLKEFEERMALSKRFGPDAHFFFHAHVALPFINEKNYYEGLQKLAGIPFDEEFQDILFTKLNPPLVKIVENCNFKSGKDVVLDVPKVYAPKEGLF